MQPDQLPALPEPSAKMYWLGYNDDDMKAFGFQCHAHGILKERARADALQAENTELKAELKTVYQHHADEEARADALEAALRELVMLKDLKDGCQDSDGSWMIDDARLIYEREKPIAWAAARSLIEPTKG